MAQSISEYVERISSSPGVLGAYVTDKEGAFIEGVLDRDLDALSKSSWIIGKSIAGVESFGRKIREIDLRFEKERIIVKNLENGYLYLFCKPRLNVFLLWLSTNLDIEALDERLQGVRGRSIMANFQRDIDGSGSNQDALPAQPTDTGTDSAVDEGQMENVEGMKMIREMEKELRKIMGPIAPLLMVDRLSSLGQTKLSFDPERFDDLLRGLCEDIPDNSKRMDFQRNVRSRCSR